MMIWGHRGHRHHRSSRHYAHPPFENTLLAFQQALAVCMGVECDLIQSREGTIYLAHGTSYDAKTVHEFSDTLDEKSKSIVENKFIYQLDNALVNKLRLIDGRRLPTIHDVLRTVAEFPGHFINFELKGPLALESVIRFVQENQGEALLDMPHCVFSSFYTGLLVQLRKHYGTAVKIACLFDEAVLPLQKMYPGWENAPQDAMYIPFRIEDGVLEREDVRAIQPDFFNLEIFSITDQAIEQIRKLFPQAQIILWTSDEPHPDENEKIVDAVERLAPTGLIYALITDFPEEVQKHLAARGVTLRVP